MPLKSAMRTGRAALLVAVSAVALAGCQGAGLRLRDAVRPAPPYEQYVRSLRHAGLDATSDGAAWLAAGEQAVQHPLPVAVPFIEIAHASAGQPAVRGYQVELRRGQRLTIEVLPETAVPARVFLDVFSLDAAGAFQRLASGEAGTGRLMVEPPRDGTYVVRVQPDLTYAGQFRVEQRVTASLAFPVANADSRAVGSFFGAARDGGRREHHGIDIFAPRGTPVLAAAEGRVTRVDTTGRGGHVVWVRDARGYSYYYAHLDEQLVSSGQRVAAGEPLGTVGNTGNARGTPPHLHFGVYRRGDGPVDPFPYVDEPRSRPGGITASVDPLGTWSRTASAGYRLRAGASTSTPVLMELPRHMPLRVDGVTADWYRVALPDGTAGFVTARGVQPLGSALRQHRAEAVHPVWQRPYPAAAPIASLDAGLDVPVLATYEDYVLVRMPDGREGWTRFD